MTLFLLIIGGILFGYISTQMETKKEGSAQARVDQSKVLFDDMAYSPLTLFLGTGLGHTVEIKTQERDYRGATYYELQTLYIFNQLGLINFTILILANIVLAFRYIKRKDLILVYSVYVAYAFTNPYMWDTNQVVVITSLLCARSLLLKNRYKYQSTLLLVNAVNN